LKVTLSTEPLLKSMPGVNPESPESHPDGIAIEMIPGNIIKAENKKYQNRLPTTSITV